VLDAHKVLVTAPSLEIFNQVHNDLINMYGSHSAVGKVLDARVYPQKLGDLRTGRHETPDLVTTNIQKLVSKKDSDEEGQRLSEMGRQYLSSAKPDLVIVDEGHHNPANSWDILRKEALHWNPKCKFVLLTATPRRSDGKTYGLKDVREEGKEFFYLYTREEAIRRKELKTVDYYRVEPTFTNATAPDRYEEEEYMWQMLNPAV